MKTNKLMLCVLGFMLIFTVAAASAVGAPKTTFKFKTVNVPGALQTFPAGVNNKGVTVGQYQDKKGVYHGYILQGKKLIPLDDPRGGNTGANGINYNGAIWVVGQYTNNSTHKSRGFLYKNGKFTDIPGPNGARSSEAEGINDQGWIVGHYADSNNHFHGFLLKGKKYKTLDVPTATFSGANGINNQGSIVLSWVNSSGAYEGALTKNFGKTYKTIKVPGAGPDGSFPSDLNNEGDITFTWYDSSSLQHGALLDDGKYYKFDYPKAVQTNAAGINDRKALVGYYQDKHGNWSGFEATFK
jgi:uncharacterized membrane protein